MSDEIRDHIEALIEHRQQLWKQGLPANAVEDELNEAWEELRRSRTAQIYGSPEEIARRARIELQLEKLMTGEEDGDEE